MPRIPRDLWPKYARVYGGDILKIYLLLVFLPFYLRTASA